MHTSGCCGQCCNSFDQPVFVPLTIMTSQSSDFTVTWCPTPLAVATGSGTLSLSLVGPVIGCLAELMLAVIKGFCLAAHFGHTVQ